MKIQFPVIILSTNDPIVYFYSNYKELKKTSEELLEAGIWNTSKIIDSQGNEYDILEVKKSGLRGFFGWHPLLKGKSIWIDFTLSSAKPIIFNELKTDLLQKVEKSKSFWTATWDIKDLKKAIADAATFKELISLFQ